MSHLNQSGNGRLHEYQVQLTFFGAEPIQLRCREDEDIISAGLRQGLLLASDCRQGICGACLGFLEEGQSTLLKYSPYVLSDRDKEDGWVLTCRLRPKSDLRLDFEYSADRVAYLEHWQNASDVTLRGKP